MKKMILIFLISLMSICSAVSASAASVATKTSSEREHVYLVQLVNQLNAMMPLIIAAEKAQPANQRITFHYSAWKDAKGKKHNGLLEDVQLIKKAIEEKLNTVSVEPRVVSEIRGDYIN